MNETITDEERETVLGMMQAANEHMDQLRAAIDVQQVEIDRLRDIAAGCGKILLDMQARVSALESR